MTRERFIKQLEREYPGIQCNPESVSDYLESCRNEGCEPWTAMFVKYWAG